MESLPDDVVVHVFSFLPPRDLLGPVRSVCHAWRRLALHRDVWRHASVLETDGCKVAARALRLAPCLRSLEVHSYSSSPEMQRAIDTTACQVQRLRIDTHLVRVQGTSFQSNAGLLAHFRRVLSSLLGPSLRTRAFSFWWRQVPHTRSLAVALRRESFRDTLSLVQKMALEELEIQFHVWGCKVPRGIHFDQPSRHSGLKRLSVEYCFGFDQLIEFVVMRNAASLREFILLDENTRLYYTLKALRALKGKLKLTVPATSLRSIIGMDNLGHLTVRLFGHQYREAVILGLEALSRGFIRAPSITLESLSIPEFPRCAEWVLYNCLREMGTLGCCGHVQSLAIRLPETFWDKTVTPLTFLSGMPALRELRLQYVRLDHTALNAIRRLQSLRLLDLGDSVCGYPECCVPALRSLIASVPGLHVLRLQLEGCCQDTLSLPHRERNQPYGLRGHCPAKCATCAEHWHHIGGRWH